MLLTHNFRSWPSFTTRNVD